MRRGVTAVIVCLVFSALGWAGGFETAGIGARQMNMGGAAIGLADDWTALFWNPAGLGFLEGSQIGFDLRLSQMTQSGKESLRNVDIGGGEEFNPGIGDFPINPAGGWSAVEPSRYGEDSISANQMRPDVGWYKAFDKFTFAIGFFGSGGLGADWEDTINGVAGTDQIKADYHTSVFVLNIPVGFGMKIDEKQSFGATLQLLYGNSSTNNKKTYTDLGSALGSYQWINKSDSTGYGLELDLGYLYKVSEDLSLGAVYRSHYVLNSTGDAESGFSTFGFEESDMEMSIHYPQRIGIGAAWHAKPNVLLAADIYWIHFGMMNINFDYDTEGAALSDRRVSDDLKSTYQIRLGCEWTQSETLTWRFGYYSDASPYPEDYSSVVQSRYPHADVISAGFGYKQDNISYNTMLNYAITTAKGGNSNEIDSSVYNLAFGMVIEL